ncbi:MAG: hypothetical protein QXL94_00450 [Candidatus Parvarchaeum sp.]
MYEIEAQKTIFSQFPTAQIISMETVYGRENDTVTVHLLVSLQVVMSFQNGHIEDSDISFEGVGE